VGGAIHGCGGARMGSDPATSVLNEFTAGLDVPNLFVRDGSRSTRIDALRLRS
jgi:choline dehydrogenase-like flavoprotein